MRRDISDKKSDSPSTSEEGNRMDRREFFVKAGRMIIPTIGVLGLSLTGFNRKVQAADCDSICTGKCQGACTGCTGSCSGSCDSSCVDTCKNTCSGMTNKK